MTTTIGITRRIDHLGRIVVPAELRRSLGIRDGDAVEISERDGKLVLRKIVPQCALCSSPEDLIDLHEKHVCNECVRRIRLEPACAMCGGLDNLSVVNNGHVCKDCAQEISVS